MANINLKSNLSRTIVPDSLTTSVLFDIAFDNGFQKISEYLSEDAEDVEDSTKLQTEAIIKSISERATCNNQTLVSLMTFLKFIYEYDNKLAKVVPIRKYDRHADRGMEFLFAVFGDNIGSEIDKLRSKSKLREDSNFSLVTIIASYILKRINLRLINSNFETFELFELLKNYSKPLEVEVVSAEKIQNHSSRSKSKTKSIAFVILALLIPAAILIFYFLDFWGGVSSRGQVSKVSFSTFASAEFEKLSPISVASKSFVNRLITSVTNYFQKDDEATGTKIASIVGDSVENLDYKKKTAKTIGDDLERSSEPGTSFNIKNSPVKSIVFGTSLNYEQNDRSISHLATEKEDLDPSDLGQNVEIINIDHKSINPDLIYDLDSFFKDSAKNEATFLLGGVNFKFEQVEIDPVGKSILIEVSNFLKPRLNNSSTTISITGHTDSYGNDFANRKISLERAVSAKNIFVKSGIQHDKIEVWGVGGDMPLEDNSTVKGRYLNRRLTLKIKK